MARSKFGRWFFGEDRPDEFGEGNITAGWYQIEGTLRYHDGEKWTGHIAPTRLTRNDIALGVFAGVLAALFMVWLGAQISPDHIYLPVKTVVKELPQIP